MVWDLYIHSAVRKVHKILLQTVGGLYLPAFVLFFPPVDVRPPLTAYGGSSVNGNGSPLNPAMMNFAESL